MREIPQRTRRKTMNRQEHDREALVFAHYYLGSPASNAVMKRYATYLELYPGNVSSRDTRLLQFGVSHPRSIALLDAGLAVVSPQAELRRRLYVMFALLESDRSYTSLFLSRQRSGWYVFRVVATGFSAAIKAIAGILLVRMVAK
jgi:hypothetical protein